MVQEQATDDEDKKEEDTSAEEFTGLEADKYKEAREGHSKNFFESDTPSEAAARLKGDEDRIDAEVTKKEQEESKEED